ncbi:MAG: hypothetical protein CBC13_08985 [Planctomycetia bacterium TMED53]|nr:MAG: hypothetical protein CBC13_08985 [Planctomycetia bacterium TMED53]
MSRKIQQLPQLLIDQIAAGEVIERPASVVKELIENCLDAGSTRIDVDLEEGGKRLIQVVDDGQGIEEDQLPLALASHATSKLREAEELDRILTLGFRGEALSSMCAVATVEIASRTAASDVAHRIVGRHGQVELSSPVALRHGTRIRVEDLFSSVPARRKFLKSNSAEVARCSAVIKAAAMAHPTVGFSLTHDGRTILKYPADQSLPQRIAEVLGEDLQDRMLPIVESEGVSGWIARPDVQRRNSDGIWTFLNGRTLKDSVLQHGVREGFKGYQIPGFFPVAVVGVEVDPGEVDVNVHPSKLEVRFRNRESIHRRIRRAIRATLEQEGSVPKLQMDAAVSTVSETVAVADASIQPTKMDHGEILSESGSKWRGAGQDSDHGLHEAVATISTSPTARVEPATVEAGEPGLVGESVRVFQVNDAFLILEEEEGLRVIDQHALHEKVLYEEILENREQGGASQGLLVPETVPLDPRAWAIFVETRESLSELGLEAEEFGEGVALIRAIPHGFEGRAPANLLRDILSLMEPVVSAGAPLPDLKERLLQTMACKAAVKAGQPLSQEAMEDLVRARGRAFQPENCPHGRPSELFISWLELQRRFDRK